MAKQRNLTRRSYTMEMLEPRQYMSVSPTLLASISLPGAGASWDFSKGPFVSSPVFADLDGNGTDELLVAGGDNQLHAYGFNGATAVEVRTFSPGAGLLYSTPVVVNLPTGRAVFIGGQNGKVYGFSAATAQLLPGWPQSVEQPTGQISARPPTTEVLTAITAADIDGDGIPEIVTTGFSHELNVWKYDGTQLWQFNNDDTVASSPVVGDLNGDGSPEIVFGGDSSGPTFNSVFYWDGGRVNVISASGQREVVFRSDQVISSSPALADLDGDGYLDVVVGTGYYWGQTNGQYPGNKVYAFDRYGNPLPGWPFTTEDASSDGRVHSSPAIADLNRDGQLDVVVADGSGNVIAISGSGAQLWKKTIAAGANLWSSAVIADVNGDGNPDVIIGAPGFVYGLDGATGNQLWRATIADQFINNSPAIGHFRGDASWQLAIQGNPAPGGTQTAPTGLTLYDLPATSLTPPWAGFRRDGSNVAVARDDSLNVTLIQNLYRYTLNRDATQAEINTWLPSFSRSSVLQNAILNIAASTEVRTLNIQNWYQQYLNRGAEQNGLNSWLGSLASGNSYGRAQVGFAASEEAFTYHGGGTNSGWVTYLYNVLLARDPSPQELYIWVTPLNAGTVTRDQVAAGFLLSQERTENTVKAWYTQFQPGGLTVPSADTLEEAAWDLRRGARTEEQVLADILASQGDYVTTQTEGSLIRGLYHDILGRQPAPSETRFWLTQMELGATQAETAASVLNSREYQNHLVAVWFQNYLGRAPSADEVDYWGGLLAAGTPQISVIKAIVSSPEYFTHAGGTNDAFVSRAYHDLLGRTLPLDDGTLNYWRARYSTENILQTLPQMLLISLPHEYNTFLVNNLYLWYMRRYPNTSPDEGRIFAINDASPFARPDLVAYLDAGGNPDAVRAELVMSAAYPALWRQKAAWYGARWLDNEKFFNFA